MAFDFNSGKKFDFNSGTLEKEEPVVPQKTQEQGGLFNAIKNTASEYQAINRDVADKKIGIGEAMLQTTGTTIAGGFNTIANLPVIKQGFDLFGKGIQKLSETSYIKEAGDAAAPVTGKILEWWDGLSEEDQRSVRAAGNILSVIPVGGVTNAALKPVARVAAPLVKATGEVVAGTGRVFEGAGSKLMQSAITPTVKEAERLLTYNANNPFLKKVKNTLTGAETNKPITRAQSALENTLMGTEKGIGTRSRRVSDAMWKNKIEPAVNNSPKIVSKEELFSPIEKLISETAEPGRRQAFMDAYDAIKEEFKASPELISLSDAQKLKSALDEFTPAKAFRGQDIASAYTQLRNEMADGIRQITYDTLDDVNIKKAYIDYGNLKELEKIGVNAISSAGTKGGSGQLVQMLWNKATIPMKTISGQVLYRVGNVFEFIGEKGIKTFGEFLKKQGYEKPGAGVFQMIKNTPNKEGGFLGFGKDKNLSNKSSGLKNYGKFTPPETMTRNKSAGLDDWGGKTVFAEPYKGKPKRTKKA